MQAKCLFALRDMEKANRPLSRHAIVPYMFAMTESRHVVDIPELERNLRIWLSVISQRRASVLRDLWTRRGEEYDATRIEHARHELARYLAEKLLYSHELTRAANAMDEVNEANRAHEAQQRAQG